jgi:alcohol dehydrogenase, propanol-preferring
MECTWRSYPPTPTGQVGGHEGVGVVVQLGPNFEGTSIKLGQRVGIKYVAGVCMNCDHCLEGMEALCEKGAYSGFYTPVPSSSMSLVRRIMSHRFRMGWTLRRRRRCFVQA